MDEPPLEREREQTERGDFQGIGRRAEFGLGGEECVLGAQQFRGAQERGAHVAPERGGERGNRGVTEPVAREARVGV